MSWTEQTRASLAGTACVREAVRSGYMFVCLERDKNRAASGSGGLWSRHTLAHTHIRACIRAGLFRRAACVSRDVGQPSLPSLCSAWTPLPKSHAQLSRLAVSFHAPLLCPPPQDTQAPIFRNSSARSFSFGQLHGSHQRFPAPRAAYGGSSSDSTFLRNIREFWEQGSRHSGRILRRWCI